MSLPPSQGRTPPVQKKNENVKTNCSSILVVTNRRKTAISSIELYHLCDSQWCTRPVLRAPQQGHQHHRHTSLNHSDHERDPEFEATKQELFGQWRTQQPCNPITVFDAKGVFSSSMQPECFRTNPDRKVESIGRWL